MENQDVDIPVCVWLNTEEEVLVQYAYLLLSDFKRNSLIRNYKISLTRSHKIKNRNEIRFWKDIFDLAKGNLANDPFKYIVKIETNDNKRTKALLMVESVIYEAFYEKVKQVLIKKQKLLKKEEVILKTDDDLSKNYKYQINIEKRTIRLSESTEKEIIPFL